jgi:biotin operon repressor
MTPIVTEIREGAVITGWEVIRTGLRQSGQPAARCRCPECQAQRVIRTSTLRGGGTRPCRHRKPGRAARRGLVRPPLGRPGPSRIHAWATQHAAGRTFTTAEAASALDMSRPAAAQHIGDLIEAGHLVTVRYACYALPGAGPFPPADQADREKITLFLAADGGGAFAEIRAATGYSSSQLTALLTKMADDRQVIRLDEGRGGFYLLPGQEPGQVLDMPGT